MSQTNPPIRIALVITGLQVGGAERCCVELAKRLDRTRYELVVYSLLAAPSDDQSQLYTELRDAGISVHFLGARSWFGFPRVLVAMWRHLRRQRPHIVQSFLFHGNFVAAIAARLANVPLIITGIRVAEARKWHLRLARLTDRFVARHVCVSQAVADFAQGSGRLPVNKLVVIANGVDLERFARAVPVNLRELGVPVGRRVITFVGRLDAQKGLGWLLHMASKFFAQFNQHDLLVVGQGPAREDLERMVKELGIDRWVRFAGWRADVPAILASSDVLVLPSRWEGMPNVVLEAMAAGKPVVACDVEGVSELLGPWADAQVVPPGDAEAFLDRLAAILEDAPLASELGTQNRRRAEESFGLETMVAKYDLLYTSLLR